MFKWLTQNQHGSSDQESLGNSRLSKVTQIYLLDNLLRVLNELTCMVNLQAVMIFTIHRPYFIMELFFMVETSILKTKNIK
jgi:hypothetical protein